MDASELTASERVPASRKLGKEAAQAMLNDASKLIVAKGKKLREWEGEEPSPAGDVEEAAD